MAASLWHLLLHVKPFQGAEPYRLIAAANWPTAVLVFAVAWMLTRARPELRPFCTVIFGAAAFGSVFAFGSRYAYQTYPAARIANGLAITPSRLEKLRESAGAFLVHLSATTLLALSVCMLVFFFLARRRTWPAV